MPSLFNLNALSPRICLSRETSPGLLSTPFRRWRCALPPVARHGRSCWGLIKVRNDWHVSITLHTPLIFEYVSIWPKCKWFMMMFISFTQRMDQRLVRFMGLPFDKFALLSYRTVWFASLAGLQLRRDSVGKRSPVLCPLPRVRGNCQQPAGHWYRAAATPARSGGRYQHRRAEKCGHCSREAVPLWAQVPRLPRSADCINTFHILKNGFIQDFRYIVFTCSLMLL